MSWNCTMSVSVICDIWRAKGWRKKETRGNVLIISSSEKDMRVHETSTRGKNQECCPSIFVRKSTFYTQRASRSCWCIWRFNGFLRQWLSSSVPAGEVPSSSASAFGECCSRCVLSQHRGRRGVAGVSRGSSVAVCRRFLPLRDSCWPSLEWKS